MEDNVRYSADNANFCSVCGKYRRTARERKSSDQIVCDICWEEYNLMQTEGWQAKGKGE